MAPFRLPFSSKKSGANGSTPYDENTRPQDSASPYGRDKPSLALDQKGSKAEPNEFKLSSVNDSGEYLPPSPIEQRGSFWGGKSPSSASTAPRSVFSENEPFSISRESFDSYRRSFDVSGRSPIIHSDSFNSRASMDSRRLPRAAMSNNTFDKPLPTESEETGFEEVGLNDDKDKQQPKKKSFLARFGDSNNTESSSDSKDGKHHFGILSGRKRGQSGTGSELNSMNKPDNRPSSKGQADIVVR